MQLTPGPGIVLRSVQEMTEVREPENTRDILGICRTSVPCASTLQATSDETLDRRQSLANSMEPAKQYRLQIAQRVSC